MKDLSRTFASLGAALSSRHGSRFRRNFLTVAKANVTAQALSLAFAPLLARLYTSADFGSVAIFASVVGMLASFSTWRFEWSVPAAGSRLQATALMGLGLMSLSLVALTSFLTLRLLAPHLLWWAGFERLQPFLPLVPLALVGIGLQRIMQAWFIREGDLTTVSETKIVQSVAGTGFSVIGGLASAGAFGLIFSSVASAWLGLGILIRHAVGLGDCVPKLSLRRIAATLSRFGRESSVSTSVSIIAGAGLAAPPLLLAQYYSAAEVGWYAVMFRLAAAPVGVITSAIGQSFFSEAAILVKTDRNALGRLYVRTAKRLTLLAIPAGAVCLFGPLFVGPLFGDTWRDAGFVLMALGPGVASGIIVQPVTHLVLHHRQHWKLLIDAASLLAIVVAIPAAASLAVGFPIAVLVISLIYCASNWILYRMNLRCVAL